ncbi:uncharacterized protein [Pocillopora verrucosa]|uniref:uncharacterized protein isoform X2 n=1 Tax=Pocillopora verrucosa TaxID=203993 RepID=UPI00333E5C9A
MNFAKIHVWIVLAIDLLLPRTDGERLCSCYSFNNKTRDYLWPLANGNCKHQNKHLVVMETEQEWEFIKNAIQNREGSKLGEWFIGLEMNLTIGNWTWINGKPLTIDKWTRSNPDPADFYGLIHKEYPTGYKGSFSTIRDNIERGWICEKESDNCQGDCFLHHVPQSTSPPGTKAFTTKARTSTEQNITDVSAKSTDRAKSTDTPTTADDKSSSSPAVMIVGASLGAVLFVALIILIIVILLRRKKRQGKDTESALPKESLPKMSAPRNSENDQLGESQYESVNRVEAAKLLGSPKSKNNTRFQPTPENCEYAVVNKANKKRKQGDPVYAQLAEFDHEVDATKPPKPPSYEPTVYADVEVPPPELPGREDSDSSQPTYANLETTGV